MSHWYGSAGLWMHISVRACHQYADQSRNQGVSVQGFQIWRLSELTSTRPGITVSRRYSRAGSFSTGPDGKRISISALAAWGMMAFKVRGSF